MNATPYPAFGYVIFRTALLAGETLDNDNLMVNNVMTVYQQTTSTNHGMTGNTGKQYIFYIFSGSHNYRNIETGETYTFTRGYCSLEQGLPVGTYEFNLSESGEFLCFNNAVANQDKTLPPLEVFKLEAGESTTLPLGTKLYLGEGSLDINGVTIPSMKQIKVVNEDKIATALGDCYGFIFKD
jgi:hypothetical protein